MDKTEQFSEIFEAMVMDHSSRPRNFEKIDSGGIDAEGVNPLTGDQLLIQFQIKNDQVERVCFTGKGSALALASASILTQHLKGLSPAAAQARIQDTLDWINDDEKAVPDDLPDDEFGVLLEIRHFPHRRTCASMAWRTALSALGQYK